MKQCRALSQLLLVCSCVLSSVPAATAYPLHWHNRGLASSCTDAPTSAVGGHTAPVHDATTTVEVALTGQPVTTLCPGQLYELTLTFAASMRAALLSVSHGSLAEANVPGCGNTVTTSGTQRVQQLKAHWMLPCGAAGSAEVRVASGLSPRTSLKVAVATLPISPACAASTCRPSSDDVLESSTRATARGSSQAALESGATGSGSDTAAPAPAPATASDTSTSAGITLSDNPAAGSSWATYVGGSYSTYTPSNTSLILPAVPDDDPTVQTVQLLVGSACPPSSLGYVCSQQVADSVKLHYSYRTAQPGNSCTQGAGFDVALGEETDVMHFAIESTLQGYAAIGFPLRPGSMTPADAVVGSVDDAAGSIQVDTYRLTWADPAGVTAVPPQWATGLGAVRTTSGQSKVTIMCFSRPLAANGTLQAVLQPAEVPVIWAAHTSPSLRQAHVLQGSLSINMLSGQPMPIKSDPDGFLPLSVRYAAQVAHGILMAAAFCIFMPAGVLVARHRWLFAHAQDGKHSSLWFPLHQALQNAAVTCVVASFVVAMGLFFPAPSVGSLLHRLHTPHFALGLAVLGMALLQALIAMRRPAPGAKHRSLWGAVHSTLGYATLGLGMANCFIGVVLAHDLKRMSWPGWLVPMCLLLGSIVLVGLVLEAARIRVWLRGRRDAGNTCKADTHHVDGLPTSSVPDAARAVDRAQVQEAHELLRACMPSTH